MDVNFDNGTITNGSLQVDVATIQSWSVNFAGLIDNGAVELNSLGGILSNPGEIISSSINASLGGVFTGNHAEAFIGGFDLTDAINKLNFVEGIYTIEK